MLAVHVPAGAEDAKSEAVKHFEIGLELVKQEAWDAALAEFLESRKLFPTKNALKNAAVCLRELKRWDEALDMYDELLERFGKELSGDDRKLVDDDMAKLAKFVGTIAIVTDVTGARVVIDGRERGVTPTKPLRVALGTRSVTVTKSGYAPFETKVQVSSGSVNKVQVTLAAVGAGGKLKVIESTGAAVDVVLDGAVVGKTPWEGTVTAGTHTIALRAGKTAGTIAQPVTISANQPTELTLTSAELPATLRVETTPVDAEIELDGKVVGKHLHVATVPLGEHTVIARSDGYEEERHTFVATAGGDETMKLTLAKRRRIMLEAIVGILPGWYHHGTTGVQDPTGGSGIGMLRVGYRVLPWLGVDLGGGFAYTDANDENRRPLERFPVGYSEATSQNTEMISQGPLLMLGGAVYPFPDYAIRARLSAGLHFLTNKSTAGQIQYTRPGGSFGSDSGNDEILTDVAFALMPEVRAGIRFSRAFSMDVGIVALVTKMPEWQPGDECSRTDPVCARRPGLTGGPVLTLLPTIGGHFDL